MSALNTVPLQAPGSLGLNTEDQDSVLDHRFCTVGDNCVLSRNGRIESRKGWDKINSTAATGTPTLDVVHSYVTDSGTEILISTGGMKLWTGDTTLTDSTGSISVTLDDWQFQNTQGNVYGAQDSHEPICWDGSGNFEYLVDQNTQWATGVVKAQGDIVIPTTRNGYYYECTTAGTTHATTEPTWPTTLAATVVDNTATWTTRQIPASNVILAAFGRLWLADAIGNRIYYSDLLIPSAFDTGGTGDVGSSGFINLNTVWVTSNDNIVALSVHNNNLIILCKKSVVIYSGADDVVTAGNFQLSEVIENIGCVARDSVQAIGQDLLWLSEEGVRSLGRTVIQDNMPLSTISSQVRTELIGNIENESDNLIRSVYNEREGLYLLSFPTVGIVYSFDMRGFQEGILKPFIWDSIEPYGMATRRNGDLAFGFSGGFLGKYSSYLDDTETYIMKYRSGWIDPGSEGMEMIWKKMRIYLYSNYSVDTTATWGYDFETSEDSQLKNITSSSISEYNISEYGVAEYGSGTSAVELVFTLTGTGELVRVGFQATVNSGKIGVNKITLQAKRGKVN